MQFEKPTPAPQVAKRQTTGETVRSHETQDAIPSGRGMVAPYTALGNPRFVTSPKGVLALQRSAGNSAVATALSPRADSPREEGSVQRAGEQVALDPRVNRLEDLRNILHNTLTFPAAAFQIELEGTRARYGAVLGDVARNYEAAWKRHHRILGEATVAAENENMVRGVVIGAAASVVAAAAAGAIPAVAALEVFTAGWWASTGVQAAASSAGGTAAASYLMAPTNFHPAVPEALGELQQLRQLLSFERSASRGHGGVAYVGQRLSQVDVVLDELTGGSVDKVTLAAADEIIRHAPQIEALPSAYTAAWERVVAFRAALEGWTAPSQEKFEQTIWVHWIGSLSMTDHDVLDRDEVEDYLHGSIGILGSGGILGVDTREVFDTDKEKDAIRAARGARGQLLDQLSAPAAPG